jgi:uncharacterized protein (TIGR00290 family)
MLKVVVTWSGGKESSFACYKAVSSKKFEVSFLLNMITTDAKKSMTHGIRPELLIAQSKAIGIPIIQRKTTWNNYEKDFKEEIVNLKQFGIKGIVFGDIDLQEHRDWDERVCDDLGVEPIFPLWGQNRITLLESFIDAGFEAFVVTLKANLLSEKLLGCQIDKDFIKELSKNSNIDLCGERGEYHTFVTDGPLFKKRIKLINGQKILKDKYWFWDITEYEICKK